MKRRIADMSWSCHDAPTAVLSWSPDCCHVMKPRLQLSCHEAPTTIPYHEAPIAVMTWSTDCCHVMKHRLLPWHDASTALISWCTNWCLSWSTVCLIMEHVMQKLMGSKCRYWRTGVMFFPVPAKKSIWSDHVWTCLCGSIAAWRRPATWSYSSQTWLSLELTPDQVWYLLR